MNLDDLFDEPPRRRKRRDPLFADSLDVFDEPSASELRRQESEARRTLSPEEETSVLGKVGELGLSGLGWVGEVLDKYTGDRALRGLLAGKPRELASVIPFSDDLGITRKEDITTGKDLNKQWFGAQDDPNSWWDDLGGMATEVVTGFANPANLVTGAFDAVSEGGKIAQKVGLFDNAAAVASRKAGKAVGGFESQMTTSLRDLLDHTLEHTPELHPKYLEDAATAAKNAGKKLDDVLDLPLGHRLGYQIPFTDISGPLPGFAAGDDLGLAVARGSDWLGDKLMGNIPFTGYSPLTHARSLFDPGAQGSGTRAAQEANALHTNMANAAEPGIDQLMHEGLDIVDRYKDSHGLTPDIYFDAAAGVGKQFVAPADAVLPSAMKHTAPSTPTAAAATTAAPAPPASPVMAAAQYRNPKNVNPFVDAMVEAYEKTIGSRDVNAGASLKDIYKAMPPGIRGTKEEFGKRLMEVGVNEGPNPVITFPEATRGGKNVFTVFPKDGMPKYFYGIRIDAKEAAKRAKLNPSMPALPPGSIAATPSAAATPHSLIEPQWLHRTQFDDEALKLRNADRMKEYVGLAAFDAAAGPAEKKLIQAFFEKPNVTNWDAMDVASKGSLGKLTLKEITDAEDKITTQLGDWGRNHAELVRDATRNWSLAKQLDEPWKRSKEELDAITGKPEGVTRLYRIAPSGKSSSASWMTDPQFEGASEVAKIKDVQGRWFTDAPEDLKFYADDTGEGWRLQWRDMNPAEAEKYRVSNLANKAGGKLAAENPAAYSRSPKTEFFLPKGEAATAPKYRKGMEATPEAIHSAEEVLKGQVAKLAPKPDISHLPDEAQAHVKKVWAHQDANYEARLREGVAAPYHVDAFTTAYMPRFGTGMPGGFKDIPRDIDLRHFPGSKNALRDMLADTAIDNSSGAPVPRSIDDMAKHLDANYKAQLTEQIEAEARMNGRKLTPAEFKDAYDARIKGITTTLSQAPPEARAAGILGNDPIMDVRTRALADNGGKVFYRAGNDTMAEFIKPFVEKGWKVAKTTGVDPKAGMSLGTIYEKMGMHMGDVDSEYGVLRALDRRLKLGLPTDFKEFNKVRESLGSLVVPQDIANDILRSHGSFELPDSLAKIGNFYDSATQLFKSFTLAHPATKVRDLYAGQLHSAINGVWSAKGWGLADGILRGVPDKGWAELKPIQEILERQGIPPASATAEQATHAASIHLASMGGLTQGQTSEVARKVGVTPKDMLDAMPGKTPKSLAGAGADAVSQWDGSKSWLENLFTVEGVLGATETRNPLVRASNYAGNASDFMNRVVPYLSLLEQGYSPSSALQRVMAMQIDYSPKSITNIESKTLAKLFPFYKFTRGMAKQLTEELWKRPHGAMAATIKGQAALARQDENNFVPDHIRQTMAVPLGAPVDGNQTYLTSLGLMSEDPFSLVRPGANIFDSAKGLGQELVGRMNPLLKAPLEVAFGQQAYSGRDLRDLEGGLSRAIGNVAGMERGPDLGILTEEAVAASPFGRAISTVRTAADPRKSLVAKAINLGTGARLESVDLEKAKNVSVRKALTDLLRGKPGIAAFEHLYAIDANELSPEDETLMKAYRAHAFAQQQAARAKKQPAKKKDALDELLGL